MKHLHLDCFAGISGDMMVGALLDLGWPEESMRTALGTLGLQDEFHVHIRRVQRGMVDCVKFDLHSHHQETTPAQAGIHHHGHEHQHDHAHPHSHEHPPHAHGRSFREITNLINTTILPEPVKERILAVFQRIAVAEGKIHGQPPEDVAFHEVGAVDSIGDIVAACAGLHGLGVTSISAGMPVEGTGWIQCAHGKFPLPAPATLEILQGIPLRQIDEPGERITPTGAALLAEFPESFGPAPAMRIERIGYGAGSRNPASHPNLLRVLLGEKLASLAGADDNPPSRIVEISCNLDDCTPEILSAAMESLLEAGALDAHILPCQMKKSRPGFLLTVLAREEHLEIFCRKILTETTAFGVRWHHRERLTLERSLETIETPHGPILIKLGRLHGGLIQVSPEFSSCLQAGRRCGVSVHEVYQAAQAAARTRFY